MTQAVAENRSRKAEPDYYQTPGGRSESSLVVKNSRFIGSAGPASTTAEAQAFIAAAKARFPDANHHPWAYKVETFKGTIGSSDDGEPGGTAGRPMLAVLEGSGLLDAVIVGTRYFGGIKLGPGGLVRAYSDAAREALVLLPRVTFQRYLVAQLSLPYPVYQRLLYLAKQNSCRVLDSEFGEFVNVRIAVKQDFLESVHRVLADASNGQLQLHEAVTDVQYLAENE
ncbi:MAG: IMPACT family protein [Anaerolineae bacterium]